MASRLSVGTAAAASDVLLLVLFAVGSKNQPFDAFFSNLFSHSSEIFDEEL